MTATSGQRSLALLKNFGPLGACLKTLVATSQWASTMCFLTWKPKATPAGQLLFQLSPSMPSTAETEFGLFPTATTQDNIQVRGQGCGTGKRGTTLGGAARFWPTPDQRGFYNEGSMKLLSANLDDHAEFQGMTYRAGTKREKFWPTPMAHEVRLGYQDRSNPDKRGTQKSLTTEVVDDLGGREAVEGQLNPDWVEWLMGYPVGWTDIGDGQMSPPISPEFEPTSKTVPAE